MTKPKRRQPNPRYRFERYTDGCDDALDIYRDRRKRPIAKLRYWTATGITDRLTELFVSTPDLLATAESIVAGMEDDLLSPDEMTRYVVERDAHTFVGLFAGVARARMAAGRPLTDRRKPCYSRRSKDAHD